MLGRKSAIIAATAPLLCLASCGTAPKADIEKQISDVMLKAEGHGPDKVVCPEDLPLKKGTTTRCMTTTKDAQVGVTVTVTDNDGHVHVKYDDYATLPEARVESSASSSLEKMAGVAPDDVDCPAGLPLKVGHKMRCTLTAGSDKLGFTLIVTEATGGHFHFDIQVDDQPR